MYYSTWYVFNFGQIFYVFETWYVFNFGQIFYVFLTLILVGMVMNTRWKF